MYSLRFKCKAEEVDLLSADLWEAGTAGIREVEDGAGVILIAGFESNAQRAELLEHFAGRDTHWDEEDSTDWVAETHRAWPPRSIGECLFLAPAWSTDMTPPGKLRITHNPGLACGTGEHPCTQLALEALERSNPAGKIVIDIGTGSGLLAIAALRLGAISAIGIDPDEAALQAATENFNLNKFNPTLAVGYADCLRDSCAHITVANISATVLLAIGDDLLRIVAPGGTLILTGFTDDELPALEQVFGSGLVTSSGEWRCLSLPR